ncbi:dethiobiotin synthase [Thiobacillus sp.]
MKGLFVTGTDTGVGKTRVAVALIHALRARGLRVAAMKPVSAGCAPQGDSDPLRAEARVESYAPQGDSDPLRAEARVESYAPQGDSDPLRAEARVESYAPGDLNEDVVALLQAANVAADIRDVNPYAFVPAIAPHIAAEQAGVRIELEVIAEAFSRLAAVADVVVVEGAGGWRVPLNEREDMADLAQRLGLPVVLVVGLRLGCLNHAVLAAESIANRKLPWAGWVGNAIDPEMACQPENVAALRARLPGPCLGIHSYQPYLVPMTSAPEWLALPEE